MSLNNNDATYQVIRSRLGNFDREISHPMQALKLKRGNQLARTLVGAVIAEKVDIEAYIQLQERAGHLVGQLVMTDELSGDRQALTTARFGHPTLWSYRGDINPVAASHATPEAPYVARDESPWQTGSRMWQTFGLTNGLAIAEHGLGLEAWSRAEVWDQLHEDPLQIDGTYLEAIVRNNRLMKTEDAPTGQYL